MSHDDARDLANLALEQSARIRELKSELRSEIERRTQAEAELFRLNHRFKRLCEATHEGLAILERGRLQQVSCHFAELFGYDEDELDGMDVLTLVNEPDWTRVRRHIEQELEEPYEVMARRKDGTVFPLEVAGRKVAEPGRTLQIIAVRDISFQHRAREELRESEERFRIISEAAKDSVVMMDERGCICFWNPAAEQMFGHTREEALGCNLHALLAPPEFHGAHQAALPHFQATGQGDAVGQTLELSAQRQDGTVFPIELSVSAVEHGGGWHAVGIVRDITDRVAERGRLEREARRDRLTGLHNRTAFDSACEEVSAPLSMIVCDLDGLKQVNDTLGHDEGDRRIQAAAAAIRSCFRDSDMVARLGGDEFAVLLPGVNVSNATLLHTRILTAIEDHNRSAPDAKLSLSIGCATRTEEPCDVAALYKKADTAMYRKKMERKTAGRNARVFL